MGQCWWGCDGVGISFNGIDSSGGGVSDRFVVYYRVIRVNSLRG